MNYNDVKKLIRKSTKKINNDKCYICKSNKPTENHHLLRVADLAEMCVENNYFDIESLYSPRVNLCNLHHQKWHSLTDDTSKKVTITEQEIDQYICLLNEIMVLDESVPDELVDSYIELYDKVASTVEDNLEKRACNFIHIESDIKQMFDNDISYEKQRYSKDFDFEFELLEV